MGNFTTSAPTCTHRILIFHAFLRSRNWTCPTCNKPNVECLPDPPAPATSSETSEPSTAEQKSNPPPAPISATESSQPSQPPPAHQQQPSSPSVPLLAPTPTRPVASVNLVVNQEPTSPVFIGPSTPVDDPSEEASSSPSVTTASASHGSTSTSTQTQSPPSDRPPIILRRSTPRPPIILDTAICVLLVLVFALICRRVL